MYDSFSSFPLSLFFIIQNRNLLHVHVLTLSSVHLALSPSFPSSFTSALSSVLKGLMDDIRQHVGCLYRLSECVAMLDMLHSFAHSVTVSNYGTWRHLQLITPCP